MNLSKARILLVDDEALLLESLAHALSKWYEVVKAGSVKEALTVLKEDRNFEVVVSDLMMPEMNGMDFYETLKKEYPGTEKKIIFITGGAFTKTTSDFLTSIPNPMIEKPFTTQSLRQTILKVLDASKNECGGAG